MRRLNLRTGAAVLVAAAMTIAGTVAVTAGPASGEPTVPSYPTVPPADGPDAPVGNGPISICGLSLILCEGPPIRWHLTKMLPYTEFDVYHKATCEEIDKELEARLALGSYYNELVREARAQIGYDPNSHHNPWASQQVYETAEAARKLAEAAARLSIARDEERYWRWVYEEVNGPIPPDSVYEPPAFELGDPKPPSLPPIPPGLSDKPYGPEYMQARAELDAAQAEYDRLLAEYEKTFDESFRRHHELQAIASSVYRSIETLLNLIRVKNC